MQSAGARRVVVRRSDTWYSAPVGEVRPTEIGLVEVLDLMDGSSRWDLVRSGPAGSARIDVPVQPERPLVVPWIMVAAVLGAELVVEDVRGGTVLLDDLDVRIIDAVVGGVSAVTVAERMGRPLDEVLPRVRAMASAGLLTEGGAVDGVADGAGPQSREQEQEPARGDMGDPWSIGDGPGGPPVGRLRSLASKVRARVARTPVASPAGGAPGIPIDTDRGLDRVPERTPDPGERIPVYTIWHEETGPLLSTGMLTAFARSYRDGVLEQSFEIRRPETAEAFLEDLSGREGPAVLLCSDYVWSIESNLAAARLGRGINPALVIIHGGPSCPKYEADAERFLVENEDVVDVLVRGEGEVVLSQILEVLSRHLPSGLGRDELVGIGGLTFRSDAGELIRTPDQERIADLDALPSPYLTGEFDDFPASAWTHVLAIETNRGCPYGCTFCDWGSSTLSRVRKFDLDRVAAEIAWAAERSVNSIDIADANFGIMARDVEIARRLAEVKRRTGFPNVVAFYPAKNTTKHLVGIMDHVIDAGILMAACLALQTADPTTLEAIHRVNISTDAYLALAAAMRRRGLPLQSELIVGLPGQTVDSYRRDLQFMSDHEMVVRTYPLRVLPNAPLRDPAYREEHDIVFDDRNLVVSTSTFTPEDLERMMAIRRSHIVFEQSGLLRHVLRYLQWDHAMQSTDVVVRIMDTVTERPEDYPLLAWIFGYFDIYPAAPVGWSAVFVEVRRFILDELGIEDSTALDAVLAVQEFVLPSPNRQLPATMHVPHDYVEYRRSANRGLYRDGRAGTPDDRLEAYPPAEFTVEGDPLELCSRGLYIWGDGRDPAALGDFNQLTGWAYELLSPLMVPMPLVVSRVPAEVLASIRQANAGPDIGEEAAWEASAGSTQVRVPLGRVATPESSGS